MTYARYAGDRLAKQGKSNVLVIKPDTALLEMMPIDCSVCKTLMRTSDDEVAWSKHGCCNDCAMRWAAARADAWSEGWRPSKEEIREDVASRQPIIVTVNVDI